MPPSRRRFRTSAALIAAVGLGVVGAYLISTRKSSPPAASHVSPPASTPASLPLQPVVARILHEGPDLPYLKFNYLIKELPLNLAPHDIQALITFISASAPPKFQDAEWGSLVNDIEECLTVQTLPSEKVADALIAIFRDPKKIQMQRDYALQHLGGFAIYLVHTGGMSPVANPRPTIFSSLLTELKSAAAQTSQPWSGTALNLLDGLLRAADYRSVEIPGLTAASLVETAIPIARNPSAPLNARLPALQVAARHDSPAARDLAREILSSPEPGIMLTQSASATLARLGTTEDLPALEAASSSASRHTAPALNEAIRAIHDRSHPN